MSIFLRYFLSIVFPILSFMQLHGQIDSSKHHINERLKRIENDLKTNPQLRKEYEDLTFYYSQYYKNLADSQQTPGFKISGYIDAYYAKYSDKLAVGAFQKFPTSAPISDNFGLNIAQISMSYQDKLARGIVTFHAGDIPSAAWSNKFNFIQEANAGIKLFKNTWLDAGFFRTHIGFESIQPRENIGSSIALTTYYEPYYLSGAKLSCYATKKLMLQASVFNGFNTFVPINSKKAIGLSAIYEVNPHLIATFNTLLSDNSPDSLSYNQPRCYNNFYLAYKSSHWDIGFEMNYGLQKNTGLIDSTGTAEMFSMLVAGKYKFKKGKFAIYGRGEIFNDKNEILTGPVVNQYHTLVGVQAIGGTLGFEFKPINNSFLRLESRSIHLKKDENIFYTQQKNTNLRLEFIASLGIWF